MEIKWEELNPGTADELGAYQDHLEEIRNNLEAQFTYAETCGDAKEAYRLFGELMSYHLIDPSDPRCVTESTKSRHKPVYKNFYINGSLPSQTFFYDIRKNPEYIGVWPFSSLPSNSSFSQSNVPYWGIRKENGFECPSLFPSVAWKFNIAYCNAPVGAECTSHKMVQLLKTKGTNLNQSDISARLLTGYERLYTITNNKWATQDQSIGYIYLANRYNPAEGAFNLIATIIINWDILVEHFINIPDFQSNLENIVQQKFPQFHAIYGEGYTRATEKQAYQISRSNETAKAYSNRGYIGDISTGQA